MTTPHDEYVRITTFGQCILPECRSKYTGSVWYNKPQKRWVARFGLRYPYLQAVSFESEEDAIDYIKRVNVEHGLPILNLLYLYGGEYYCELSNQQLLKFSHASRSLVESRTWTLARKGKPGKQVSHDAVAHVTREELDGSLTKKTYTFRRMMFPYIDEDQCVRCRNGDTLDGTLENVYVASLASTFGIHNNHNV